MEFQYTALKMNFHVNNKSQLGQSLLPKHIYSIKKISQIICAIHQTEMRVERFSADIKFL